MKKLNGVWYEVANFPTKTTHVRIKAVLTPATATFRVQGRSGRLELGPQTANTAILEFPITKPPGDTQTADFFPNFVDSDPKDLELRFSLEEIVDGAPAGSSFPDAYILKKKDVLGVSNPDLPHTFTFFIV